MRIFWRRIYSNCCFVSWYVSTLVDSLDVMNTEMSLKDFKRELTIVCLILVHLKATTPLEAT